MKLRRYWVWRCKACGGRFEYPAESEPHFCPYCRSRDLRPAAE